MWCLGFESWHKGCIERDRKNETPRIEEKIMNVAQTLEAASMLTASQQYKGFSAQLDRVTQEEISFSHGLSAFEEHQTFHFRKEPRLKPFIYMHSTLDANVSFVCVDPFILSPSYVVSVSQEVVKKLELSSLSDALILCLVSVGKDMYTTTANLMSPIIINPSTLKGEQLIMENIGAEFLRFNVWNSIGNNSKTISNK